MSQCSNFYTSRVRRITRITRTCVYLKSLQLLSVRVMAFLHHPRQPASPAHTKAKISNACEPVLTSVPESNSQPCHFERLGPGAFAALLVANCATSRELRNNKLKEPAAMDGQRALHAVGS
jgi:hypothetical protein